MKKMKRFIALALMALSLFAVALPAMSASNLEAGDTGIITVKDVNGYVWLRTGAGTGYAHNDRRLYANCELYITGKNGVWYQVRVSKSVPGSNGTASTPVNQTGYVHQDYVVKKGTTTPNPTNPPACTHPDNKIWARQYEDTKFKSISDTHHQIWGIEIKLCTCGESVYTGIRVPYPGAQPLTHNITTTEYHKSNIEGYWLPTHYTDSTCTTNGCTFSKQTTKQCGPFSGCTAPLL